MGNAKGLVGFIGEIRAGKDTAERLLMGWIGKEMPGATLKKHRFSQILEDTLELFTAPTVNSLNEEAVARQALLRWGLPKTYADVRAVLDIMDGFRSCQGGRTRDPHARENMQFLSMDMDARVRRGALSFAMGERIKGDPSDIVVLNGLRWDSDVEMFFSVPNRVPILIGITASEETRYRRALLRTDEKTDEVGITLEEFRRLSAKPTETNIPRLLSAHSTLIFRNEGVGEETQKNLSVAMYGAAVFVKERLELQT